MVIYMYGAYAGGSTRIDDVTRLEHEELTDVADQARHGMYHVSRMPALYRLSVEVEMEMQVLHVIYLRHVPTAALSSKPLARSQGSPFCVNCRCRSRAVKSMPTVTAST